MARAKALNNATGQEVDSPQLGQPGQQDQSSVLRQVTPFTGQGPDQQGFGLPSLDSEQVQGGAGLGSEGSRSGESPRERDQLQNPSTEGAPTSSLRRPSTPTPMAGSSFTAGGKGGVLPFQPMGGGTDSASLVVPGGGKTGGSLFGSLGGLKGGGLGVPLDPVSDQQSDPIQMLLKLLQRS